MGLTDGMEVADEENNSRKHLPDAFVFFWSLLYGGRGDAVVGHLRFFCCLGWTNANGSFWGFSPSPCILQAIVADKARSHSSDL